MRLPVVAAAMLLPLSASAWYIPEPGVSWHIQYTGTINPSLNKGVYNIDLFDTPLTLINQLKANGKKVICYFSAGSWENWRPDRNQFPSNVIGRNYEGWAGEKYLDIRAPVVADIMKKRIQLAYQKGCDAVDPDNVDIYDANTGFPLTEQDSVNYLTSLATYAHVYGLGIGLKNSTAIVNPLVDVLDFATVEECREYGECYLYSPFVNHGKAVFAIEYRGNITNLCNRFKQLQFSGVKKRLSLNAWSQYCQ